MARENFCVARVATRTRTSVGKFERHIERKNESYENMNVDLSRTPMNVCFKGCSEMTYNEYLDKMVADGTVSLRGLKPDAKVFDEVILDVNTDYFEQNGGYEYACRFYEEAFHFTEKLYGKGNIFSAVMHADELNVAMTEKYGKPVYHYHLHVVALPVVDKEVKWTKRCKEPALVGTVKEVIHQVSHSKKWKSEKVLDEDGKPVLNSKGKPVYRTSYSILQDQFFEHMTNAGFTDVQRGERGSTAQHLTVTEFKVAQEQKRLSALESQTEETKEALSAKESELKLLTKGVKDAEQLVKEYCGDLETVLPKPDMLESGKAYRENKAAPILKGVQGMLRKIYGLYLKAKKECERLTLELGKEKQATERLLRRNELLEAEGKQFDVIKKAFGTEVIDRVLEQELVQKVGHKVMKQNSAVRE